MKPSGFLAAIALAAVAFVPPSAAHAQGPCGGRPSAPRNNVVFLPSHRVFYGYSPFFYDPWFAYPFGWYGPYGYGYGYGGFVYNTASLRLQVSPKEAEVFVDGYYAGRVDDFDGTFQRLHLDRGEHEVTLYLGGFRTVRQRIYLEPNGTFKVNYMMQPLGPGEAQEPPPSAPAAESPAGRRPVRALPVRGLLRPGNPPEGGPGGQGVRSDGGSLAVRVQPGNAEVRIDGERWDASGSDDHLVVQLAPGQHRVEVRRDGYKPYEADVTVRAGETATLNVSLSRE